jgi:hypothetical protein
VLSLNAGPDAADDRAHGEIHDALHDRRRRVVRKAKDGPLSPTGRGKAG